MPSRRVPFRGFSSREWMNLLAVAAVASFVAYTALTISVRGVFDYIGIDFRAYLASGATARYEGFQSLYDLSTLSQYQKPVYEEFATGPNSFEFATVPTPYLPAFIYPFIGFSFFRPVSGFLIWLAINLAIYFLYLWRIRQLLHSSGKTLPWYAPWACLPLLLTLFFGQVNIMLFVATGEFLISAIQGRNFTAGLWLSLLFLKPQILIVLIPGLVLSRSFRILFGLLVGGFAISLASSMLAGMEWWGNLARLILMYPGSLPTTFPESMMNWRALGINLAAVLPGGIAWGLAMAGLVGTMILALTIWVSWHGPRNQTLVLLTLIALAASNLISWHSHVHVALPILVVLLIARSILEVPDRVFFLWAIPPTLLFVWAALLLGPGAGHLLAGQLALLSNLGIIVWAITLRKKKLSENHLIRADRQPQPKLD